MRSASRWAPQAPLLPQKARIFPSLEAGKAKRPLLPKLTTTSLFTARFNNHNYKLGLTLHPGKALAGISHPLEGREVSLLPLTQALLGFLSNKRLLWIFCSVSLPQCTASIPFSPAMRFLCQQQTQSHRDVKSGIVGLRRGSTRETKKRKFRFKGRRMLLFAP